MLKIKELLQVLIETQKQINKSIKELNESTKQTYTRINSTELRIGKLETCLETNVYTKEETTEAINKEMDYKERLKKVQKQCPELLELIEIISTNYAKMDKYAILNTTEMFSEEYKVEKVKEEKIKELEEILNKGEK